MKEFLLVFLGGVLSIGTTAIMFWIQKSSERKTVVRAFAAEISALLGIVERRGYVPLLEGAIQVMRSSGNLCPFHFTVEGNYFSVFEKNVDKIGVLPADITGQIVTFYTQTFAILEDIRILKDSPPSDIGVAIAMHEQLLQLFRDTKKLGENTVLSCQAVGSVNFCNVRKS